jgi:aminopeptidase-like protein
LVKIISIEHQIATNESKKPVMCSWTKELFPMNRTITGNGTRNTLGLFQDIVSEMKIHEIPSGTISF